MTALPHSRWLLALAVALLSGGASRAADPNDLAELFPAGTLAYAEVGNPSGTSEALAAFVKGTLLADSLAFSHDRRDKLTQPNSVGGLAKAGEIGLLTSPEMLAELKKMRGIAAGLTGFDAKTGRPHMAVAIVLGESAVGGLLARQYLLTAPNIRRVGKVEGVPVYQNRGLTGAVLDDDGKPQPVEDPVPAQGLGEATYLYAPGLFVYGSSVQAVGDVYRRFTGLEKSASCAGSPGQKARGEARKKPGIWFCVDAPALDAQIAAAKKVSKAAWLNAEFSSYVRFLLNPKQVESLSGSLHLMPEGWSLTATAEVKAGGSCPLLALLNGNAIGPEEGRGVPADARGSFALAFPSTEKRSKAILDGLDALASASGRVGATPGELVAEAEKSGFKLGGEFLPKVQSMTLVLPKAIDGKKPAEPKPVLILTLDDEASATAWLAVAPKLSHLIAPTEKPADPASEMLQGVKVWGLVHGGSTPIHYAQAGPRIVAGRDRDAVALGAKQTASPWAKTERPANAEGRLAFSLASELLAKWAPVPDQGQVNIPRQTPEDKTASDKLEEEWNKATAAMPPVILQARGNGQTLTLSLEQRDLKKPLAKWLELGWQWLESNPASLPGRPGLRYELRIPDGAFSGRSAARRDIQIFSHH